MNSAEPLPPIAPECACTITVSTPQRWKMRSYAPRCASNAAVQPGLVEIEGVGVLHRELADPQQADFGRGSSRNLVWIWYQTWGRSR